MSSAESSPGQPAISLRVSVPDQRLDLFAGEKVVASYPISTSKYGLGSEPGSFRTPTGRFVIAEMIGDGAAPWTAFKAREPIGIFSESEPESADADGILTRILWLDGVDPHNANTHDRYIYIHGTNQESLIGSPASHGCVRMRNADVANLFQRVHSGTPVEIVA